jgi:hypothetical protein
MRTNEVLTRDYDFLITSLGFEGLQCTSKEHKCMWAARHLMWLVEGYKYPPTTKTSRYCRLLRMSAPDNPVRHRCAATASSDI